MAFRPEHVGRDCSLLPEILLQELPQEKRRACGTSSSIPCSVLMIPGELDEGIKEVVCDLEAALFHLCGNFMARMSFSMSHRSCWLMRMRSRSFLNLFLILTDGLLLLLDALFQLEKVGRLDLPPCARLLALQDAFPVGQEDQIEFVGIVSVDEAGLLHNLLELGQAVCFPLLLFCQLAECLRGILPAPLRGKQLFFEVVDFPTELLHCVDSLLYSIHLYPPVSFFLQRHYSMIACPVEGP